MYIFIEQLLDFIFPPSEESLIVRSLQTSNVSSLSSHSVVDGVHVLSSYKDARVRALVHEGKFHYNTHAFLILNQILSEFLATYKKPIDYILPIPLSKKRKRMRGYNQVYEILRAQRLNTSVEIHTNILIRKFDTKPQTELAREKRLTNVQDAFGIKNIEAIRGKHILIVDDVTTTGATLRAAKAALLPHGAASITCIALAH